MKRPPVSPEWKFAQKAADTLSKMLGVEIEHDYGHYYYHKDNISFTDHYGVFKESLPAAIATVLNPYQATAFIKEMGGRWLSVTPEMFVDTVSNRIGIRVPYNAQMIDELKRAIPAGARVWESATKTWYVNFSYLDALESVAKRFFPGIKMAMPDALIPEVASDTYTELLKPLPAFALKAMYRSVMACIHPDKAMQYGITLEQAHEYTVNFKRAWDKLCQERDIK
jgi:hypothetical protein